MPDRPLTAPELAAMFEATDNAELARQERAMKAEPADRLAEIQARANRATRGPWELDEQTGPNFYGYLRGEYLQGVGDLNFGEGDQADADRKFTIHARTDMDWLIAEVARLHDVIGQQAAAEWTAREDLAEANIKLATAERQLRQCDAVIDSLGIPDEPPACHNALTQQKQRVEAEL
jgi:hypothetical protein